VVGGGPTGCEFAGELHDLLDRDLRKFYSNLMDDVSIHLVQSQDKILNSFDKTISEFAEAQFSRENVIVHTDSRVKTVNPTVLVTFDKKLKRDINMPYGMCVWATGIEPVSVVKKLCETLYSKGQTNRMALIVDDNLIVKGTNNIFALGDCSTLERRHLKDHLESLFISADVNGDGQLSWDEFHDFLINVSDMYPQLEIYNARMFEVFKEMDVDKSGSLSHDEFRSLIERSDSEVTVLPATAQVASQEGKFIGKELNQLITNQDMEKIKPFRYRHHGSFAGLGGGEAVGEVPGMVKGGGIQIWLMWRGIYLSKQFTPTNMLLLCFDWLRTSLFGRDISRF